MASRAKDEPVTRRADDVPQVVRRTATHATVGPHRRHPSCRKIGRMIDGFGFAREFQEISYNLVAYLYSVISIA
jgi:hypothetical protein